MKDLHTSGKQSKTDQSPTIPSTEVSVGIEGSPASYPKVSVLPQEWFARDTVEVAQSLVGHCLLRTWPETGEWVLTRIVETEAYTQYDPACHAYQKAKGRAATLYKSPGLAYVYLIYGMYHCLNVVTEPEGVAGAVLFRALEVLDTSPGLTVLPTNGPGKLCKALQLTRSAFNEKPLDGRFPSLVLAAGSPANTIVQTTRIGITQAKDWPWRFYDAHSPCVSKRI